MTLSQMNLASLNSWSDEVLQYYFRIFCVVIFIENMKALQFFSNN